MTAPIMITVAQQKILRALAKDGVGSNSRLLYVVNGPGVPTLPQKRELKQTMIDLRLKGLVELTRNGDWVITRAGITATKGAQ